MRFIKELYLSRLFFIALISIIVLFVLAFIFPLLLAPVKVLAGGFLVLSALDYLSVFRLREGVFARRQVADRLSNGSPNEVVLYLENRFPFTLKSEIIDELPIQFQQRDTVFKVEVKPGATQVIKYTLHPTERGVYNFGAINVFALGPLQLIKRRFRFSQGQEVAVYPSFVQMRQYELLAISNRLSEIGVKKVRRLGHSMEFEQIRAYTIGDDQRAINWKASAKHNSLMVNSFQDEKSQQVYCLIDKGRAMQMPFGGMTLLDYAINATLVVSNVAMQKHDKAGIVTFANKINDILPAERRPTHLQRILELLYHQQTRFLETDYELLYATVRSKIRQRSLLVLFTNFETLSSMRRQLPYLRRMAKDHLLLVVFFENTELRNLLNSSPETTEEIYLKTIGEKFAYEKRQIVKELAQYGIQALLTPPQELTINTLNRYLALKARGLI